MQHLIPGKALLFKSVGCWNFMFLHHLRSHQDGYRFVTVHTYVGFIVLPQWAISLSHSVTFSWHRTDQSWPNHIKVRKWQVDCQFDKSLVWLDLESNSRSPARETRALLIRPPRPVTFDSPHWYWLYSAALLGHQQCDILVHSEDSFIEPINKLT